MFPLLEDNARQAARETLTIFWVKIPLGSMLPFLCSGNKKTLSEMHKS